MKLVKTGNGTHGAEYEITVEEMAKGILSLASEYGDGNDTVAVYDDDGEVVASATWDTEEKEYIEVETW